VKAGAAIRTINGQWPTKDTSQPIRNPAHASVSRALRERLKPALESRLVVSRLRGYEEGIGGRGVGGSPSGEVSPKL
jgi:hypothetical protein